MHEFDTNIKRGTEGISAKEDAMKDKRRKRQREKVKQ